MSTKKKEGGIDFGKLKEACKVFNEREYKDVKGNIINIKYVAKPVPVIIENFMTCCERLPGPVQDALPDDDVLTVMFQEIEEEQKRVLAADQAGKKVETVVVESTDVGKVEDVLEEKVVEEKKPEVVEEEKVETIIPEKEEPEKGPVKRGRKPVEKKEGEEKPVIEKEGKKVNAGIGDFITTLMEVPDVYNKSVNDIFLLIKEEYPTCSETYVKSLVRVLRKVKVK